MRTQGHTAAASPGRAILGRDPGPAAPRRAPDGLSSGPDAGGGAGAPRAARLGSPSAICSASVLVRAAKPSVRERGRARHWRVTRVALHRAPRKHCLANHAWRVTQTIVTGHQRSPPPPIALPDCSHGRSSRVAAGPRRPAKLRRSPRLPRARCRWCHVEIGFGDGISTHTPHLPAGMMRSYGSALRPNCLAKPATVSVWVAPNVAVDSGSSRLITYAVGRPPIAVPTAATTARKNTTSPAWTAE